MVQGKKYQVWSINMPEKNGQGVVTRGTVWVRCGIAFLNKDDSMNLYLDVLPKEGRLHIREAVDRRDLGGAAGTYEAPTGEPYARPVQLQAPQQPQHPQQQAQRAQANGSPANAHLVEVHSVGGH